MLLPVFNSDDEESDEYLSSDLIRSWEDFCNIFYAHRCQNCPRIDSEFDCEKIIDYNDFFTISTADYCCFIREGYKKSSEEVDRLNRFNQIQNLSKCSRLDVIRKKMCVQNFFDDFLNADILCRDFQFDSQGAKSCMSILRCVCFKIFWFLIRDSVTMTEYRRSKTVSRKDVNHALMLSTHVNKFVDDCVVGIMQDLKDLHHEPYVDYKARYLMKCSDSSNDSEASSGSDVWSDDDFEAGDSDVGSSDEGISSSSHSDFTSSSEWCTEDDEEEVCEEKKKARKEKEKARMKYLEDDNNYCFSYNYEELDLELDSHLMEQFDKASRKYPIPILWREMAQDYKTDLQFSYFALPATFMGTRKILILVLEKLRYLRGTDVFHFDIFVKLLHRRLAESSVMSVFQTKDLIHHIRELLFPAMYYHLLLPEEHIDT